MCVTERAINTWNELPEKLVNFLVAYPTRCNKCIVCIDLSTQVAYLGLFWPMLCILPL